MDCTAQGRVVPWEDEYIFTLFFNFSGTCDCTIERDGRDASPIEAESTRALNVDAADTRSTNGFPIANLQDALLDGCYPCVIVLCAGEHECASAFLGKGHLAEVSILDNTREEGSVGCVLSTDAKVFQAACRAFHGTTTSKTADDDVTVAVEGGGEDCLIGEDKAGVAQAGVFPNRDDAFLVVDAAGKLRAVS